MSSQPIRWTPRRIQNALLCPKPTGARARVFDHHFGRTFGTSGRLDPTERRALRHIAEHADLLDVKTPFDGIVGPIEGWLLVPAPSWLIQELATFESAASDIEPCDVLEEDDPAEENQEDYADADFEPGHVTATNEQRDRYRAGIAKLEADDACSFKRIR